MPKLSDQAACCLNCRTVQNGHTGLAGQHRGSSSIHCNVHDVALCWLGPSFHRSLSRAFPAPAVTGLASKVGNSPPYSNIAHIMAPAHFSAGWTAAFHLHLRVLEVSSIALQGWLEGKAGGSPTHCDVRDVALAHIRAAETPPAAGRYIVSHQHTSNPAEVGRWLQVWCPALIKCCTGHHSPAVSAPGDNAWGQLCLEQSLQSA